MDFGRGKMFKDNVKREDLNTAGEKEEGELRCPQCGSTRLIYDSTRGEIICANCGYVMSEREVDQGAEWRAFTPEEREKRSRVGAPISRYGFESPGIIEKFINLL